jgi:hypothetical protein
MDDRLLMIVLRLLHIIGGTFWVGTMLVAAGFLYPAAQEGPAGGRVLQQIMMRYRLSMWLSVAAAVTVLSGLWMYGRVAVATGGDWMRTRPGVTLGVGGLLAIAAAATAGAVSVPTGRRLGELGARVQQAGGAPAPTDVAEVQRLQARLLRSTRVIAALLVLTAAAMAVARYL